MFRWFERLLDAYPATPVETPPASLLAFYWHFIRPAWKMLAVVSVLSALIAIVEVAIYGFMGTFVDWLSQEDRATFFERNGLMLAGMLVFVLVVVPVLYTYIANGEERRRARRAKLARGEGVAPIGADD